MSASYIESHEQFDAYEKEQRARRVHEDAWLIVNALMIKQENWQELDTEEHWRRVQEYARGEIEKVIAREGEEFLNEVLQKVNDIFENDAVLDERRMSQVHAFLKKIIVER